MTRRWGLLGAVGIAACRFGGPTGNPEQYVAVGDASDLDATADAPPADDATVDAALEATADDASEAAVEDTSAGDEVADAPPPTSEASPGSGACNPTIAVCDPVHDTGCNPLQQCDVDPSQTTTPTGLCLFNSAPADAGCTSSIFSETCGPGMTCLAATSTCRALCYCDTDCPVGQCCSDTSGPAGFLLCQPCE